MAKNKDSKNRSLTMVVIVMAIICVFVGYLVGVNLFKWMKGGNEQQVAQTQNETEKSQSEQTTEITTEETPVEEVEEEEVEEEPVEEETTQVEQTTSEPSISEYDNVYKIQVGAFSQRANAESFKNQLEDQGYNVIIKEASTYKVRVIGKESREETEKIENELIDLGYDTFIVK